MEPAINLPKALEIPLDIWDLIFRKIAPETLDQVRGAICGLSQSCRHFRALVRSEIVWKNIYQLWYPDSKIEQQYRTAFLALGMSPSLLPFVVSSTANLVYSTSLVQGC